MNRFLAFCRDGGVEQDTDAVRAFLERLVIAGQMSAATQAQAFNALVFHFKHVVGTPFGNLGEFQRSKRPRKRHASKRRSVYTERQAQGYTILARGEAYGL